MNPAVSLKHGRSGFTYIEMLVVITLIALCFVPLLQMFAQSVNEVEQYSELGTALQLGREGIEEVKNLRFTEAQIEAQGVVWSPPKDKPPFLINKQSWRIKRIPIAGSNPLEVHVEVFREENLEKSIVQFVTLIEDL